MKKGREVGCRSTQSSDESHRHVGIFFYVAGKLILDSVPVEKGEPYADAMGHGAHYEFWLGCVPRNATERRFKERVYDAFPRGRIVCFPRRDLFVLYADRCLNAKALLRIAAKFGIHNPELRTDEHYQCSGCNKNFIE